MRCAKGFTLIELMIIMSIMALTVVLTEPSLRAFTRSSKVKQAATIIQVEMQKARMEAIKRNANVGIEFVTGTPNLLNLFQDDNTSGNYEAALDTLIRTVTLDQDIVFGTNAGGNGPDSEPVGTVTFPGAGASNELIFSSNGAVYTTFGPVLVYDGSVYVMLTDDISVADDAEYAVTVGQYGAIQLFRYNGVLWEER